MGIASKSNKPVVSRVLPTMLSLSQRLPGNDRRKLAHSNQVNVGSGSQQQEHQTEGEVKMTSQQDEKRGCEYDGKHISFSLF